VLRSTIFDPWRLRALSVVLQLHSCGEVVTAIIVKDFFFLQERGWWMGVYMVFFQCFAESLCRRIRVYDTWLGLALAFVGNRCVIIEPNH
jgi:hypothetical protein